METDAVPPLVQLVGVTKTFGRMRANDGIDLSVRRGEVHVIVGENGAGKSTLMAVLSGALTPDSGAVVVDGEDIAGRGQRAAKAAGVGIVHQHFQLVGAFTAVQNVALGAEPRGWFGRLDVGRARATVRDVAERFDFHVDLDAPVREMSVGMQQRVEIIKTLSREPRVVVFDEPTAVLTDDEAATLYTAVDKLRSDGRAVVFITHKLREALAVADVVTVLRRGQLVATTDPATTDVHELGSLMVGREVVVVRPPVEVREPDAGDALVVDAATLPAQHQHGMPLYDVDLRAEPGRILGVLGVDGNGQQELMSLAVGAAKPTSGTVRLGDTDLTGAGTATALRAGLGIIPADRHEEGLVLPMSISRNLLTDRRSDPRFLRCGGLLLDDRALRAHAVEQIDRLDIRADGPDQPVGTLSGGNQQKVIIAREPARDLRALLAANPTRGLDIGSIEFVHRQIVAFAESGKPVLIITSDLDEALGVCNSIAVLHRGRIVGQVDAPFDRQRVGALMGGN